MARVKQAVPDAVRESLERIALGGPDIVGPAAEEVASRLQQLIVTHELPEGSRLPSERDLADMLSTSRPTVSQAIRILVVRGLIESRRGSGSYVTRRPGATLAASVNLMLDLNHDSVRHLADLRLWLETVALAQAIERATPDEVATAETALEGLRESAGDTASWMSADTLFHATVVSTAHNPYLTSIYQGVHDALINYEYQAWIERGDVPKWLRAGEAAALNALHVPILQALKDRDQEGGRIAVLHHHLVMVQHLAASQEMYSA